MDFVGIDKLSLLDYEDKVSAVLFFKNCNFCCSFCHNGESVLNSNSEIPFEDILTYLKSRRQIIDGVVISGGEPTLMVDLVDKIKAIKDLGFLVKLDTNGTNPKVLDFLIKSSLIDYVAMDIKNSEVNYSITIGQRPFNINDIKQSISILMNSGIEYEFRTTLVKEYHDINSIYGIGELIKGCSKIYLQKFVDRDGVIKKGLHEVEESIANEYLKIIKIFAKKAYLRGY